jgi:CHAD domain-containing protein
MKAGFKTDQRRDHFKELISADPLHPVFDPCHPRATASSPRLRSLTLRLAKSQNHENSMADGKWVAGLSPEMAVAEAAKVVLSARFEVVRHYLPLAVEKPYDHAENVHQLRVGMRRVGAALRVFTDCLPRKQLRSVKRSLRIIRRAAGDARDWDVFRLGLPAAKPLMATAGKPALDYLVGYAMGERSAAQLRLETAATVAGPGLTEESNELPAAVHEPRCENPPANFGDLAAGQFGELVRCFDEAVRANPTEAAGLHQLRILGKRSRYALEIFADCFPPEFKDAMFPAVERVQELLGDIQDATIGRDRLVSLRGRMKLAVPNDWPRFQKGVEGLLQSMRAKLVAARKSFQAWRKDWAALVEELKLEIVAATVTQ